MTINSSKIYVLVYKETYEMIVSTNKKSLCELLGKTYTTIHRWLKDGRYECKSFIIKEFNEYDILKKNISRKSHGSLMMFNDMISEARKYASEEIKRAKIG